MSALAEQASDAPAVVCVPARDEIERLPRLIRSLASQEGFSAAAPLRVVVVANNCSDGTAQAVQAMTARAETTAIALRLIEATFAATDAHVGTARRLALETGADWLDETGCRDGVLLTTDADARVPPDWVTANLRALHDAEIVGGRLVIEREAASDPDSAGLHARIERYWQAVRALEDRLDPPAHDPAPRHGDHTGASLALRASLYRAVGGLPPLRRGEDNALVARVQARGGRLRHCPNVFVHVSDRADGRAEGGMAVEMTRRKAVANGADAYRLPAPAYWRATIARRAALRSLWPSVAQGTDCPGKAVAFGLDAFDCAAISPETCPNAIAFVERASVLLEARSEPAELHDLDAALAGFDELLAAPSQADDREAEA